MTTWGNTEAIRDHLDHLRLRNVRAATSDARRKVLTALAQEMPVPLLDVTREHLETWQAALRVSVSSRDTYTYHVRGFYRWTFDYGLTSTNPGERLIRPKMPQRLPRPIPEDAYAMAIRCADDRMKAWLVLAGYAGLRAGEIARLNREHVQDGEVPAILHVVNGKGGKDRIVPVGFRVVQTLAPFLRARGPMWRNTSGRQITPNNLTQLVSAHFKALGLPYTAHNCRHRYGTRLYQLSGDLRMVGDCLGHRDVTSTALYAAWAPRAAIDAVAQLDESLVA